MIELGALLMVLAIVGFVLIPDGLLERSVLRGDAPSWLDPLCFAIVVALVSGMFSVVVGLVRSLGAWLGH